MQHALKSNADTTCNTQTHQQTSAAASKVSTLLIAVTSVGCCSGEANMRKLIKCCDAPMVLMSCNWPPSLSTSYAFTLILPVCSERLHQRRPPLFLLLSIFSKHFLIKNTLFLLLMPSLSVSALNKDLSSDQTHTSGAEN